VTVVVSTHNRAHLLRPCLDALRRQCATASTYEVIVVDNNSTDGTATVINDFVGGDSPIRTLREPRQGVSYGRNAGIAAARGRIIAFTDDDIRVAPDWVARIVHAFEKDEHAECIGGPVRPLWASPPPRWLDRRHWSPLSVTDYGEEPFDITSDRPRCLLTSNMAFRREVFDRIGVFSPVFPRAQDHELQVRFWSGGGRARYLPELVVYTMVPESRMRTRYHRRWHLQHGRMCARMELRERTRPDGGLRAEAGPQRLVAGVPAFLWRELASSCWAWLQGWSSGQRSTRLDREMRVRHLVGYIAERRLGTSPATDDQTSAAEPGADARLVRGMSTARLAVIHALMLLVVGGAARDIVQDQEHWPYSQYPMFSSVDRDWSHRTLRVFEVSSTDREVPLLENAALAPFDQCRLSTSLLRMRGDASRLRRALADTWRRLDERRAPGVPVAKALRVYELRWRLARGEAHDERPDARTLVAEYRPRPE